MSAGCTQHCGFDCSLMRAVGDDHLMCCDVINSCQLAFAFKIAKHDSDSCVECCIKTEIHQVPLICLRLLLKYSKF